MISRFYIAVPLAKECFLNNMRRDYYVNLAAGAFRSLNASRRRSFLTMLGIIIGVAAVIIIIAIGAGAQSLILSQVSTFGADLIGVLPGKSESNGPPASVLGVSITTLTLDDARALAQKSNVPHAVAVAPFTKGAGTVSWRDTSYDTSLSGTSYDYMNVEGGEIEAGRFFQKKRKIAALELSY